MPALVWGRDINNYFTPVMAAGNEMFGVSGGRQLLDPESVGVGGYGRASTEVDSN